MGGSRLIFEILLLISTILNITPENDLTCLRRHCRRFLTIATVSNAVGSQQWQWWGQATAVETEAAAGAHNNKPTNISDMASETAFVTAAVATAAMAATAAVQTAAVAMAAHEIYIKKGWKRRSWWRRRQLWQRRQRWQRAAATAA
jgi:hypothetical protein